MNESNLVVLQGHVSSEPRRRDLPSGTQLLQLEITTPGDGAQLSVPVVWFEPTREFAPAEEVTVVGHVRRRFYRTAGATCNGWSRGRSRSSADPGRSAGTHDYADPHE